MIFCICFLLFLACTSTVQKDNDVLDAKKQYEHFLNDYYVGGDVSNVDSALKYNAVLLDSDSASIIQYLTKYSCCIYVEGMILYLLLLTIFHKIWYLGLQNTKRI